MAGSIAELLSFAAAVLIAAPIALAGLDMTLRGDTALGVALLGVAAGVLLFEKYVTTPGDVPGMAVAKAVGLVAKEPDEDGDANDANG